MGFFTNPSAPSPNIECARQLSLLSRSGAFRFLPLQSNPSICKQDSCGFIYDILGVALKVRGLDATRVECMRWPKQLFIRGSILRPVEVVPPIHCTS
jgi:hypothetical protein